MRTMGIMLVGAGLVLLSAGSGTGRAEAQEAGGGVAARSVTPAVQPVSPADHHRYRDGRHRYRHRYGSDDDGYCYGCAGPGSYCDSSGCYYRDPYYGGGYYGDPYYGDPYGPGGYRGGYGCGYDYPCGPPYDD